MKSGYVTHTKKMTVKQDENKLIIGESPKLVIDLVSQNNYIEVDGEQIAYNKKIELSRDLLSGKRSQVFDTAIAHYYRQACMVAEGKRAADAYLKKANLTVREKR